MDLFQIFIVISFIITIGNLFDSHYLTSSLLNFLNLLSSNNIFPHGLNVIILKGKINIVILIRIKITVLIEVCLKLMICSISAITKLYQCSLIRDRILIHIYRHIREFSQKDSFS